jgi:DNA-binding response OmpR family regulator
MPRSTPRRSASPAASESGSKHRHCPSAKSLAVSILATDGAVRKLSTLLSNGATDFVLLDPDRQIHLDIRLRVKRSTATEEAIAALGGAIINWDRGTLSHGKERTRISRTEMRLLACLAERPNVTITSHVLAAAAWPSTQASRSNAILRAYVRMLSERLASMGVSATIVACGGSAFRLVSVPRQQIADRESAAAVLR